MIRVFSVVGAWSIDVPVPASVSEVDVARSRGVLYIAATATAAIGTAATADCPAFVLHMLLPASSSAPPSPPSYSRRIDLCAPLPGGAAAPSFASLSLIVSAPLPCAWCE